MGTTVVKVAAGMPRFHALVVANRDQHVAVGFMPPSPHRQFGWRLSRKAATPSLPSALDPDRGDAAGGFIQHVGNDGLAGETR